MIKNFGRKVFVDKNSPSTPTFGGKMHLILVMEDSSDCAWSFFLKEKSNLVSAKLGLIKNFKNKYNMQVEYLCYNNTGEKVAFKKPANKKG